MPSAAEAKRRPGRPPLGADKRRRVVAFVSPATAEAIEAQAAAEGVQPGAVAGRMLDALVK